MLSITRKDEEIVRFDLPDGRKILIKTNLNRKLGKNRVRLLIDCPKDIRITRIDDTDSI